jgi:hypothetical protein
MVLSRDSSYFLLFVNTAIQFDRQFGGCVIKVDDIPSDYLLTAKVKSVDGVSSNGRPEFALGRGHLTSQSLGDGELLSRHVLSRVILRRGVEGIAVSQTT